jgi:hypothetical protein
MWRSGAPQRRAARGAFPGADAPTCCYGTSRLSMSPNEHSRRDIAWSRDGQPLKRGLLPAASDQQRRYPIGSPGLAASAGLELKHYE